MTTAVVLSANPELRAMLSTLLQRAGLAVISESRPRQALVVLYREPVALVLLDRDLPGSDGGLIIEQVRRMAPTTPLLALSAACRRSADIIAGLDSGADAYLTLPLDPAIIQAYIVALLRRTLSMGSGLLVSPTEPPIQLPQLTIDPTQHIVWAGEPATSVVIPLNRSEFAVLLVLARYANQVVSSQTLLDTVWGSTYVGDDSAVYTRIAAIRRKLRAIPQAPQIVTVPRCGYRLIGVPHATVPTGYSAAANSSDDAVAVVVSDLDASM